MPKSTVLASSTHCELSNMERSPKVQLPVQFRITAFHLWKKVIALAIGIGGSKGDPRDAPRGSNFFYFHAVFKENLAK